MDFSGCTDMIEDQIGIASPLRILTPRNYNETQLKPIHKKGNVSVRCKGKRQQFFESLKKAKQENKPQEKILRHYKQDMLIDEALDYFKKHKFFEYKKSIAVKFVETGKIFSVKKADYKEFNLENYSKRCQTAVNVRESTESNRGSPRGFKDIKTLKRELLPQTKARSPSKKDLQIVSLRIRGTIKNFATRKFSKQNDMREEAMPN